MRKDILESEGYEHHLVNGVIDSYRKRLDGTPPESYHDIYLDVRFGERRDVNVAAVYLVLPRFLLPLPSIKSVIQLETLRYALRDAMGLTEVR